MSILFDICLKRSDNQIDSVILKLKRQHMLPISVSLLSQVLGIPQTELSTLCDSGDLIKTELIGGTLFISDCQSRATPGTYPAYTIEKLRDDVLFVLGTRSVDKYSLPVPGKTCRFLTRDSCTVQDCKDKHFDPIVRPGITDVSAGICSYMDLCKNTGCKFIHYVDPTTRELEPESLSNAQWMSCDIRHLDMSIFQSLVSAILIDPPWDIHMELSYGTMTDDEMRNLPIHEIHSDTGPGGFVFIWATTRTVEVARDCLRIWGYTRADELIWIKTNQLGGAVRSGRTGHWLNHNKEHCLVGIKGDVSYSSVGRYREDCDLIVSPVRENSRKPDELYDIIERIVGHDRLCLELFGRHHNRRSGWVTVGNQLNDTYLTCPVLIDRINRNSLE
jgi:mRNA (2'-O-methyladenosine-N6-)-methyltransferase